MTWDDAGGLYDHAPTPLSAPPPDATPSCPDAFAFDRLGGRVPLGESFEMVERIEEDDERELILRLHRHVGTDGAPAERHERVAPRARGGGRIPRR